MAQITEEAREQLLEASTATKKAFATFRREADPDDHCPPGEGAQAAADKPKDELEMSAVVTIMQPILRFLQLLCENHNRDLQVRPARAPQRACVGGCRRSANSVHTGRTGHLGDLGQLGAWGVPFVRWQVSGFLACDKVQLHGVRCTGRSGRPCLVWCGRSGGSAAQGRRERPGCRASSAVGTCVSQKRGRWALQSRAAPRQPRSPAAPAAERVLAPQGPPTEARSSVARGAPAASNCRPGTGVPVADLLPAAGRWGCFRVSPVADRVWRPPTRPP